MNILYVGRSPLKITGGADAVNQRNYNILSELYGNSFYSYFLEKERNNFWEKLNGYFAGFSSNDEIKIIEIIKKHKIDIVFVSQSFYGYLCKKIKNIFPNVKIIVFFHNIEKKFAYESIKVYGFKKIPFYLMCFYQENLAIKNSEFYITLNERDSNLLESEYGRKSNLQLPVSYQDKFEFHKTEFRMNSDFYLFVGTDFFGNITGVDFFINEILPNIDGKLIIVGKGMERHKKRWEENGNVEVYGFVDDLSSFYYAAKAVVAPIFFGGGMKTKIAEALMYGKSIIGTEEAFQGYIQDNNFLYQCDSKIEFVNTINEIEKNHEFKHFNISARNCFLENYDDAIVKIKLGNFFKEIIC